MSREVTVVSTVVSFVCLMAIVVILPMFHQRIQRANTLMRAQLHKCHQDSNEIWGQLARQGARSKRQYNSVPSALAGKCCSCQQGRPGPPGAAGKDGQPGSPGMLGTNGRNGHPGQYVIADRSTEEPCQKCPPAPQGPPGYPGQKGPRGNAGAMGKSGTPAEPGRPGPPGPTGIRGAPGEFGMQGPPGDMGKVLNGAPQGPAGRTGPIGSRGKPGTAGRDGVPGVEGFEGVRGTQGERGTKGQRGPPGPVGPPGSPGNKGSCAHCANGPKRGGASRISPPAEKPTRVEPVSTGNEGQALYGPASAIERREEKKVSSAAYGVSEGTQTEVKPASEPDTPSQLPYRAKAAPTRSANHALKTVGLNSNQQHTGRKIHSSETHIPYESYEPNVPFIPKEVRPAGYSMEQLSAFSAPSEEDNEPIENEYQPTMVRTRQGYNVQLVGGYAANPVGKSWNQAAPSSNTPLAPSHQSRQLSPPGANLNYS